MTAAGALGSVFGLMNLFSRLCGGLLSDRAAARFGMRGRLWALWGAQAAAGGLCILLGSLHTSLGATMAVMSIFSIAVQAACGALYAVVPFVSRRSAGLVSGLVAAAGTGGSAISQAVFFGSLSPAMPTEEGIMWLGAAILVASCLLPALHFPPWGSMLRPPAPGVSEELYYVGEFSPDERARGLHTEALKFSFETRSQRMRPPAPPPPAPWRASLDVSAGGGSRGGQRRRAPSAGGGAPPPAAAAADP